MTIAHRLRAVSLLLENPWGKMERKMQNMSMQAQYAKPQAISSVGVRRRAKRETALVSYNDLDATLTGRIIYTLIPMPSFEYDTPVSNTYGSQLHISCSHAHVVSCSSFHFPYGFLSKRETAHSLRPLHCKQFLFCSKINN